jgi:hypothetical protein
MSEELIEKQLITLIKKAKSYAAAKGYSSIADDFAQEVYLKCRAGIKTSFRYMFTDFLRAEYGDTRLPSGRAKSSARHRGIPFDGLCAGRGDRCLSYSDTLADPRGDPRTERFTWPDWLTFKDPKTEDIFFMLISEIPENVIADVYGITAGRISQIKNSIKKAIEDAMCLDECWDEYHQDLKFSNFYINWIMQ